MRACLRALVGVFLIVAPAHGQPAGGGFAAVRDAYRTTIAERITVEVAGASSETGAAGVEWSVVWAEGKPVARIDLGRLQIEISEGVLWAVHRHNPTLAFRAVLDESDPVSTIAEVMPPLPVPQLGWAIAPPGRAPDCAALLPGLPALPAGAMVGDDPKTYRAVMANGWVARASRREDVSGGLSSLIFETPEGAPAVTVTSVLLPAPLTRLVLEGREPVSSLTDLKAAPADIPIGSTLPTPGLMTRDFEPWSLGETLSAARDAGLAPIFGVLVLFDASKVDSIEVAAAANRATSDAVRSLRRRAKFGELDSAVMIVRPVAVLPVDLFLEKPISSALERWRRAAGETSDPVWSSAGPSFVSRLIPGAAAAVVVVDDAQTVLQSIPLDGRQLEEGAIRDEVEAALAARLRPIELPTTP